MAAETKEVRLEVISKLHQCWKKMKISNSIRYKKKMDSTFVFSKLITIYNCRYFDVLKNWN